MALPPTQFLASRELDYVCDLRISISGLDYVDSDPWGRKQVRGPHFPNRSTAERQLKALLSASRKLSNPPQPPESVNHAARRALRNSRIAKEAKARANSQAPHNPYPQPPQPPSHLKIRDNSRELPPKPPQKQKPLNTKNPPLKSINPDLPVPPPGPPVGYPQAHDKSSSSVFSSETASFASSRGRSPPGSRRPRGHSGNEKPLSEYLDSTDGLSGIITREEEEEEPLSATGAGSVASVPQSPFNGNRMKRWIGKRTGSRPNSPPSEVVHTRKGPQKGKEPLVRSLVEPGMNNNIVKDNSRYGEYSPTNSRSIEPLSIGSYDYNDTKNSNSNNNVNSPPGSALYEMVTLKTSIPDRPRESDLMEDDLEYFDDVGDMAIRDDEEEEAYEEEEEEDSELDDYSNSNGNGAANRVREDRPQLKEHMISSIKSYHGPQEDYDDDDGEFTDDESLMLHADVPALSKNGSMGDGGRRNMGVPSESDVTHSFEKPNNLQVTNPVGRRPIAS